MQRYVNVAQLRELLLGMERELGLGNLSQNEKDVLYAVITASSLDKENGIARSDDIKRHDLVNMMAQPTFHRSLKSLVQMGFLEHAPNTRAGYYIIGSVLRLPKQNVVEMDRAVG